MEITISLLQAAVILALLLAASLSTNLLINQIAITPGVPMDDRTHYEMLATVARSSGMSAEQVGSALKRMFPGPSSGRGYIIYLTVLDWPELLAEKKRANGKQIALWQNEYDRRTLLRPADPPPGILLRPAGIGRGTKYLLRASD